MKKVLIQFLAVIALFVLTFSQVVELWSAEHLTDLIMSDAFQKNIPAVRPAIVVLYETGCKNKLRDLNLQDQLLPNVLDFVVTVFDRLAAKNVWYQWDENIMDVFKYYNVNTLNQPPNKWCPTVLFQPQNWSEPIRFYKKKKMEIS